MKRKIVVRMAVLASLCGMLLTSGVALAQGIDTATGGGGAGPNDAAGELQEVVVTAERRAVDIQAAPVVVTAISGQQLESLHLNSISDLQTTVPSLQSSTQTFYSSYNIRGMGNPTPTPGTMSGVAVLRDGLLMLEPIAQNEPLFDIQDTEVLEGPQGTFVGASATAGAVEINSADPQFTAGVHGYIEGQLGNYSDSMLQGAVNLPVTDTFAARIAFNTELQSSFYSDIGAQLTPGTSTPARDPGSLDSRQVRLGLLWKPTERFQALFKIDDSYVNTDGDAAEPGPYTYTPLFSAGAENPMTGIQAGCTLGGPLNASQLVCPPVPPGTVSHSQYYYPGEQPFVLDYYGTNQKLIDKVLRNSLRLDYTFADGTDLRSQSGLLVINIPHLTNLTYGPQDAGALYHNIHNDRYYSEELDLISPTTGPFFGKLNWIAGAYWGYRATPVSLQALAVAPCVGPGPNAGCSSPGPLTAPESPLPAVDIFSNSTTNVRIAALFGQLQWQLTQTLQLQIGARENWDNNFNTNGAIAPTPGTTVPAPNGTGNYLIHYTGGVPTSYTVLTQTISSAHSQDSVPTGKIDLNWVPVTGQNFYVFYARGYKAGGTNPGSSDHADFNTEGINDWEAGWKGQVFDDHMLVQVGAYYEDYQNMQYQLYDTAANNDTTTGLYVANLSPSKIYGFQVSEQSRFGPLGVNLGVNYNKTKLGSVTTLPTYALPGAWPSTALGSSGTHPQCQVGAAYAAGVTCFDYSSYLVNVGGEALPYAPLVTANVSVDYRIPVGTGAVIDPRVTYSHTDKQYGSIFENLYNEMGARNLWDASLDFMVGTWDAQLYGQNLGNQIYIIGDQMATYYGPPRQYGARVTKTF